MQSKPLFCCFPPCWTGVDSTPKGSIQLQVSSIFSPVSMNNLSESFPSTRITSLQQFVRLVKDDTRRWLLPPGCLPWFRGQVEADLDPLPGIFRPHAPRPEHELTTRFQTLAPMLGSAPLRSVRDEWLYLMQHVGVPTRLLDWSQGGLIGLYFAVQTSTGKTDPAVWLMHPLELNRATTGCPEFPGGTDRVFVDRCDLAFGIRPTAYARLPIAIFPPHVHPRMRAQRGCFTLHGTDAVGFEQIAMQTGLYEQGFFKKYRISRRYAGEILRDLRTLGVTHTSLFPDYDGLAVDLKRDFELRPVTDNWPQLLDGN